MAITNQLSVQFDYPRIDACFDFYQITTSENYIPHGAKCLDIGNIKVESIAFENGKSLFIMSRKDNFSIHELVLHLNSDNLTVKKLHASDMQDYVLFRLFLYSLNNFNNENLSFNNLTGKFYIYRPDWMKKNKSSFTAIGINVDSEMNIIVEAATFAKLSLFKEYKKLSDYPKYVFSNKNCSLKRTFDSNTSEEVYIKKGIYNKKAEVPFLNLGNDNLKNNKAFYIYYVLELLKQKYVDCVGFDFVTITPYKTIGIEKDKIFMERALQEMHSIDVNFVNCICGLEYETEFHELVDKMQKTLNVQGCVGSSIDDKKANILLIHNREYYEQLKYEDPYKSFERTTLIQCVTVEDSAEKIIDDNEAIINTIIKESVIKNDILNKKKISLDDWSTYGFSEDYIFGKEKDGRHYFMVIHPNGYFDLYNKINDFSSFDMKILNECSDYLTDNAGQEKIVIASTDGDINMVSRTNKYTLPAQEIFKKEFVSRSKISREKYLSGVVDINLYMENGAYFSTGIKGGGMNTKIVRAPHLYKVEVISGNNIMPNILTTLSATFVKYKSFTVLPYPIKYLNEYISMMESQNKSSDFD